MANPPPRGHYFGEVVANTPPRGHYFPGVAATGDGVATLKAGATSCLAMVKVAELHGPGAKSMDDLTRKFR